MTLRSNLVSISSCWSRTTKWVFVSLLSGYSAHNIRLLRFNLLFWGLSWKDFFWGAITCSLWLMCSLWYISSGILFQLKKKKSNSSHTAYAHTEMSSSDGCRWAPTYPLYALAHRIFINSDEKNFGDIFFNEWLKYTYEKVPNKYRQESFCFLHKQPQWIKQPKVGE